MELEMLTQAASRSSTSARAMRPASLADPQVTNTTTLSVMASLAPSLGRSAHLPPGALPRYNRPRMPLKKIHFGTSGWRGIIAEDFTFDGVRADVAAIADYVRRQNPRNPRLVVGYYTRFFSDEFARTAVELLSARDVHCFLCKQPTPTPTIAYEIRRRKTDGGINFTASHNPPEYNGIKFSTPDGAPALPEVTKQLEALAEKHLAAPPEPARGERRGHEVHTLHGYRDVLFGGHPPEPSDEILTALREQVKERGAHLGLSTDGDADRFGVLDRDGAFISANHVIALLLDSLLEPRPAWPRAVARSVATTHLVDAVARHHKAAIHETPVGFKYIGELIQQDKIAIGGEESAGLSIYGHVPEKDGILACLLVAEMVARRGASLGEQLCALFGKVGAYYPVRVNLHLEAGVRDRLAERIRRDPKSFDGRKVAGVNRADGLKLLFDDDSWVLMRLSCTEPVVRCYCEAHSEKETMALVEAAKKFVLE